MTATPLSPAPARPRRLVLVAGTGTEVGKTWVAAAMVGHLRSSGHTVAARKPAQSFDADATEPTDAEVLARATGSLPSDVCPSHRWYETPMAPPMAAAALGRPIPTLGELVDELGWPEPPVDVGVVEPAGGVCSPLASDGDTTVLAEMIRPDAIVLVADAGLGTINLVRLSIEALANWPLEVFLNRFDPSDPLHRANRTWLAETDGLAVAIDVPAVAAFALDGSTGR